MTIFALSKKHLKATGSHDKCITLIVNAVIETTPLLRNQNAHCVDRSVIVIKVGIRQYEPIKAPTETR